MDKPLNAGRDVVHDARGADAAQESAALAGAFSRMRFSTADLPPRERIARYREEYSRQVLRIDAEPICESPLRVDWTVWSMPKLTAMSETSTALRLARTGDLVAQDDGRMISVMISLSGALSFVQCGREVTVESGNAVLGLHTELGRVTRSTGHYARVVIPRDALAARVPHLDEAAACLIPRTSEALRLIRGYLRTLTAENGGAADGRDAALRGVVATHFADLIALAIGATREAAEQAQGRGLRAARQQAVLAEIRCGFADPGFSAASVARRLQLSQRSIQDLLYGTGMSFSERVMEMRLQKARDMIADGGHSHLSIADIAHACGFNEVPYFNRSFRKRFGDVPSAFRTRRPRG